MSLEFVPCIAPRCFASCFLLIGLVLSTGCDGPSSVDAVARNSRFDPVIGELENRKADNSLAEKLVPPAGPSFLQDDHFACVCLRPRIIFSRPEFKNVPWDELESRLAELVGSENCRLSSIDSVWLLFDRSFLEKATSGTTSDEPPFVTVIDYTNRIDDASLLNSIHASLSSTGQSEKNVDSRENPGVSNPGVSIRVEKLNDNQIAIGDQKAISKLNSDSDAGEIRNLIQEHWDENADVDVAVTMEPIRPILTGLFEMVARFASEGKTLAQIPDEVKSLRLQVSLKPAVPGNGVILLGDVNIEDKQLAAELVKAIDSLSSVFESLAQASYMNGGLNKNDIPDNLMFRPATIDSLLQLVSEINDKKLLSVKSSPGGIAFQLGRPQALRNVIMDSVEDSKKQREATNRIKRLAKIGDAIKLYQDKYKCLPSSSAISTEESKEQGVPAQFSWRVALLPFLGFQDLYDRFDFSKPWNAEENQMVAKDIPDVFQSSSGDRTSAFQLAAGPLNVYRPDRKRPKISDFSDRKIWTAIVVECHQDLEQDWTQPDGPELDEARFDKIGKQDEFGILFVNASFQVRILKKDHERLRKILSCDGGESLSSKDFIRL